MVFYFFCINIEVTSEEWARPCTSTPLLHAVRTNNTVLLLHNPYTISKLRKTHILLLYKTEIQKSAHFIDYQASNVWCCSAQLCTLQTM